MAPPAAENKHQVSFTDSGFGVLLVANGDEKVDEIYKNVFYVTAYTGGATLGNFSAVLGAHLA